MSGPSACALGVRTPELDADWRAFLRAADPWALILFREACASPAQVRRLTGEIRDALGRDAVIWIDQEGGRVARLRPPHWPEFPPAALFGRLYSEDPSAALSEVRHCHRAIAHELKSIGVDGDFAPVLDAPAPGADPIIGDRAFSAEGHIIAALGRAALEGLHDGGVVGCIKHIPGHGRANADSHLALPRVQASREELEEDWQPFRALNDAPAAMTAHVVYTALDPERCATLSPIVIEQVIRGAIGFQGLLMSDDIDMKALAVAPGGRNELWPLGQRAQAAFAAGCDVVLQCNGVLADMQETADACPRLAGEALVRVQAAEAIAKRQDVWDQAWALARIERLRAGAYPGV